MDQAVQQIVTPSGEIMVIMPLAHFEYMFAAASPKLFSNGASLSDDLIATQPEAVSDQVRIMIAAGESPLAAWRKYRGFSQSSLAREADVSRFTIMRIEATGRGAGNRRSRKLLADALGIPISAI
jgi:DNA-binding XRE family transcriptional regulator